MFSNPPIYACLHVFFIKMSNSFPIDTRVSIVAITVAICAILISSSQLFMQYYSTAEGYRQCQASVMGPWARLTRLRWRWGQFRFETFFTTPEILLIPFYTSQDEKRSVIASPSDGISYVSGHMDVSRIIENESDEMVCWLPFLRALHQNEISLQRIGYYNYHSVDGTNSEQGLQIRPAMRLRERSWKFVSPDVVRPVAATTVSHIATMARRLGMSWTTFRPEDGVMRAEGNGHIITSTFAKSIGLVLHYQHSRGPGVLSSLFGFSGKSYSSANLYVPTREADTMAFGILPGCDVLNVPSFKVGTSNEILATMEILDPTGKATETLGNIEHLLAEKWDEHYARGFSDIIPLTAPMIRRRASSVIRLPHR